MRQIWYIQTVDDKLNFNENILKNERNSEYGLFQASGFVEVDYCGHMFGNSLYKIYIKKIDDRSLFVTYNELKLYGKEMQNLNINDIQHVLQFKSKKLNINRLIIHEDGRWKIFPSEYGFLSPSDVFSQIVLPKTKYSRSDFNKIRDMKSIDGKIKKDSILMNFPKSNLEFLLFEKELFKSIPQIKEFIHA